MKVEVSILVVNFNGKDLLKIFLFLASQDVWFFSK